MSTDGVSSESASAASSSPAAPVASVRARGGLGICAGRGIIAALPGWGRVLTVVAPDDESFGLGAVISSFTASDVVVDITASPAARPRPPRRRGRPVEIREHELRAAAGASAPATSTYAHAPRRRPGRPGPRARTREIERAVAASPPRDPDVRHHRHQRAPRPRGRHRRRRARRRPPRTPRPGVDPARGDLRTTRRRRLRRVPADRCRRWTSYSPSTAPPNVLPSTAIRARPSPAASRETGTPGDTEHLRWLRRLSSTARSLRAPAQAAPTAPPKGHRRGRSRLERPLPGPARCLGTTPPPASSPR